MVTTKLFLNNTTQAVRLPKAVAFGDDVTEVEITVEGDARIIRPVRPDFTWDDFVQLREELGGSAFPDREQPADEQRRDWS
jgi:antitoxin VapB